MAIRCEDVSARMIELLYGELPEGERAAIEAHLEADAGGCARCRAELAGLRSTRAIARQVLDEAPPARAHQAILRAAAAAVAGRPAPEKRVEPAGPTFWERLRARWTFPTLATVGAVAVFLLASKIFMEPEKTYERGRQGLAPAPAEAPAPAPAMAGEPATAPAAEAERSAPTPTAAGKSVAKRESAEPSANAPEIAAPAERERRKDGAKGSGYSGLGGLGTLATSSENKRRAFPDGFAKKKNEAAAHGSFADSPAVARAERSFAPPPPPRNAHPAPVAAADAGDVLLDREESESSRQSAGRTSRGGGADTGLSGKKSSAPARSTTKGFGELGNDLAGSAGAPAGQAAPRTPAKAAPREKSASGDRAASAPAPSPPPPASAPISAKRDQDEGAVAEDDAMEADEAPTPRDKSTRKAETPVAHADRLFSEGRWSEAAATYRDLIRRDPRNADAARWRQRLAAAEAALAATAAPPR